MRTKELSAWELDILDDTISITKYTDNYIKNNNYIDTNGAISKANIYYLLKDDGDIWLEIIIPYAANNSSWFNSVFDWVEKFRREFKYKADSIYLKDDSVRLNINIHCCSGD